MPALLYIFLAPALYFTTSWHQHGLSRVFIVKYQNLKKSALVTLNIIFLRIVFFNNFNLTNISMHVCVYGLFFSISLINNRCAHYKGNLLYRQWRERYSLVTGIFLLFATIHIPSIWSILWRIDIKRHQMCYKWITHDKNKQHVNP